MNKFLAKTLAIGGLVVLVMILYLGWARPYQLRWGATDAEVQQAMPGDELDPQPTFLATRAITIEGTPEEIWPWLLQMGYGRAGFYGYDILENLGSPSGPLSAEEIVPAWQNFSVGDPVPISSVSGMVFAAIEPNQYLIWSGDWTEPPGGFTWAIYPVDEDTSRLVSRIRWRHHWSMPGALPLDLFTDLTDHLAVRAILLGIKGRVEGTPVSAARLNTEFFLYVTTLLMFGAALVGLIVRPLTWLRWLAGLAAGLVWLVTWYAPLPLWLGVGLAALLLAGLVMAFGGPPRSRPQQTQPLPAQKLAV